MRIDDIRRRARGKAQRRLPLLALGLALCAPACAPAHGAAAATSSSDAFAQALVQHSTRDLIGRRAPAISFTTLDGKRLDLARFYGREAVYLEFWATWCVPCLQQMPHLKETYEHAGNRLFVLAVNTGLNETLPAILSYRKRIGLKMPIVLDDGRFARAFDLRATPQHVVIDRSGRISYIGHLADARLDRAIRAAEHSPRSGRVFAQDAPEQLPAPRSYGPGGRVPARVLSSIRRRPVPLFARDTGRRTVLYFFTPWCSSYLQARRPAMASACRRATRWVSRQRGRRIIGIASGLWVTAKQVAAYRTGSALPIPMVLDASGALFREFRIRTVPAFVVLDATGRILSVGQGHRAIASVTERELP